MSDLNSMKATKRKKYSYERDLEKNAGKTKTYSYQKTAGKPRKKYSYEKDIEKASRKLSKSRIAWIAVLLCLIIGAAASFFGIKYGFKNDAFAMNTYSNGEIDIIIGENEDTKKYVELGAKCISFGKDYSSDVKIEYFYRADLSEEQTKVDEVDETKSGMYYAVYTTTSARYKKTTLIRNIYVTGVEDNG